MLCRTATKFACFLSIRIIEHVIMLTSGQIASDHALEPRCWLEARRLRGLLLLFCCCVGGCFPFCSCWGDFWCYRSGRSLTCSPRLRLRSTHSEFPSLCSFALYFPSTTGFCSDRWCVVGLSGCRAMQRHEGASWGGGGYGVYV